MTQNPTPDLDAALSELAQPNGLTVHELYAKCYEELKRVASCLLADERPGCATQPTSLVNQAFVRLFGTGSLTRVSSKQALVALTCRAMRRILIEYARKRDRRIDGHTLLGALDHVMDLAHQRGIDLTSVADSLESLEDTHPRACHAFVLWYFKGLHQPDIARLLDVSLSTIENDIALVKRTLHARSSD